MYLQLLQTCQGLQHTPRGAHTPIPARYTIACSIIQGSSLCAAATARMAAAAGALRLSKHGPKLLLLLWWGRPGLPAANHQPLQGLVALQCWHCWCTVFGRCEVQLFQSRKQHCKPALGLHACTAGCCCCCRAVLLLLQVLSLLLRSHGSRLRSSSFSLHAHTSLHLVLGLMVQLCLCLCLHLLQLQADLLLLQAQLLLLEV